MYVCTALLETLLRIVDENVFNTPCIPYSQRKILPVINKRYKSSTASIHLDNTNKTRSLDCDVTIYL
jgi:hypothetical protein